MRRVVIATAVFLLAGCPLVPPHATVSGSSGAGISGTVLSVSGKPAAGVTISGYLTSSDPLTGNNSGGLIGNSGSGLIGNSGSGLIGNSGSGYRLQDVGTAVTDANGHFTLMPSSTGSINLEAVQSDSLKGWRAKVDFAGKSADAGQIQIQPTGTITGHVTAPASTGVTNFLGVDVFIPGSSYVAKADTTGNFTIDHVAAGTFSLVGMKPSGLWQGETDNITVSPNKTTNADVTLNVTPPTLTAVQPTSGASGSTIVLTGTNFGASTGEPFVVRLNGTQLINATRVDDKTIKVVLQDNLQSGPLTVSVDGVPSSGQAFHFIQSLNITWPAATLRLGSTRQYGTQAWSPNGNLVGDATATWTVSDGSQFLSVTPTGLATPLATGDATLTATIGAISASVRVRVATDIGLVSKLADPTTPGFFDGTGGSASPADPSGIAVDAMGDVFVADTRNRKIREVATDGTATVLAGSGQAEEAEGSGLLASFVSPVSVKMSPWGDLLVLDQGGVVDGATYSPAVFDLTTAGNSTKLPITALQATAQASTSYWDLAVDTSGDLFLAEASADNAIYKISADYSTDTPVGSGVLTNPLAVAVDGAGNLYVADGNRIRKIDSSGNISTLAGSASGGSADGTGSQAQFSMPLGIAVGPSGNLYVADTGNGCIRKVTPAGVVTTLANLEDDLGLPLAFNAPVAVTIDASGSLFVVDHQQPDSQGRVGGAVYVVR